MKLKQIAAIFLGLVIGLAGLPARAAAQKPNIIYILADDVGFEALGCYGGASYKGLGPVKTPNLDAMARSGMQFKYCFACPVCSPARAESLTGKYNFRVGFPRIMGKPGVVDQLDFKAHPTVALRLKEAGYVTAVVGKWHIGPPFTKANEAEEIPKSADVDTTYPHPRECGFDRQCLFSGGHLETYGEPKPGKYTPELLQKWALKFLESRKGKSEPFFLYYPNPIPHGPLFPTPLNPNGPTGGKHGDSKNFPFLMEYLDMQVGEILAKLKELGMSENTLVLFAGDNGTSPPVITTMRDGRDVKGGKGSPLDTGAWVPLLASWPGTIKPGSVYGGMVDFTDILPTCLELAGLTPHAGVDGMSFAPVLEGKSASPRQAVFVLGGDRWYVRDAKWKLTGTGQLFNVSNSPYVEAPVKPDSDTPESRAARVHLQSVLDKIHPEKHVPKLKGHEPKEKPEAGGSEE